MSLFCPECKSTYDDEGLRLCPADGTALYAMNEEPDLCGAVIDGRFRMDKLIGHGGMGTVYEAQQLSVGRQVAVKVLRSDISNREVALERFFREAKMISGLTHPNIVKLIDFGQDRDRDLLYLVMEFVNGTNLGDIIAKGRLKISFALEVLYQICGALTEPHSLGVIHRDLKPDNLLLVPISDGSMQAKVLDFGISRAVESHTHLTGSGMICGTPAYMAPEQAQNEPIDARTDIYALGVILYEMVSGWPPFSGTSSLQIMLKHVAEEPRPLRELIPPAALPPQVEQLVDDLLSKNRDNRPGSVQEIRQRVESLRRTFGLETPKLSDPTDLTFSGFILPKLPEGRSLASSPTEALRRETDMERWVTKMDSSDLGTADTGAYHTDAEPGLGPTIPLTPEGKEAVLHDVPSGNTRDHGQQAWTPSGQDAIQKVRRPDTDHARASRAATESRPSVASAQAKRSNTGLLLTIAVLLVVVCGAAWFTVDWVQTWAKGQFGQQTKPVVEVVPEDPIVDEPKVEPLNLEMVRSSAIAHASVHNAADEAKSAAILAAKRPPKKKIVGTVSTGSKPANGAKNSKDKNSKSSAKSNSKSTKDDFDHVRNMLRDGTE